MGIHTIPGTGYKYSLGGVNFDDFSQVKMLTLDANATDNTGRTLKDGGSAYKPGTGKAFIAFLVCAYIDEAGTIGRIGESSSIDGDIETEVLKFSEGKTKPFMQEVFGVFSAGEYINAETTLQGGNLKSGSVLYGIEVDE